MMRFLISELSVEPLTLPLCEPFRIASGVQPAAENLLIRCRLSDGTEGIGEAAPVPHIGGETVESTQQAIEQAKPAVVGANASRWLGLAHDLRHSFPAAPAARVGIEMAVLDAFTKSVGMPMRMLFGGGTEVLHTDMTITAGDLEHAVSSAQKIAQRRIKTAKVKIGATTVDADLDRLTAIKQAVPKMRLVVDANGGYDFASAVAFIEGAHERQLDIVLIEQPLPRGDDEQARALVEQFPDAPICADESARSAADVLHIVEHKTARLINIKVMKSGFAEGLAMWHIARSAGLGLMIGAMVESTVAISASAHFAAGLGGFSFVDLDTQMFITEHPFEGGITQSGEMLSVNSVEAGHGVFIS